MTSEEITIPTSYLSTLLAMVAERGYDTGRLLRDAGIDRDEIDGQRYFSASRYGELYRHAMAVMSDEWFGMLSGGRIPPGSFRLLSLLMVHSRDLRQALQRAWDFGRVCRGFQISVLLQEEGDTARVQLAPLKRDRESEFEAAVRSASPAVIRTTLAAWQRHWSWLIGSELKTNRSVFTFPRPEQHWEMAQFTCGELVFDAPFNGLEFPASYLDFPVVQNEESMEEFLRTAPYGLVINVERSQSTQARVKALLNQNLGDTTLCADQIAQRLNMSVTTLRRHLQMEGSSFQRLKDECRMEAALHYLACSGISNREIAERLGFDEVSVFFRAFKKWTGITPGQYRAADQGARTPLQLP
ncbi:AraC family transcriptional regulator [Mangrovimicrobium sediminis]|uniref:AraC family transcriptional regulator n=1 Tax=Mangrovimicrobium sediminis TaxID=2562682 RepID=A0A4Z0M4E3_9GAMM|nr:AraC family transcriptional regulator [Haliea sp. SAOS-164]TGD74310.1 AraC family transcriptional regulator [Haliea sp. SAOS-164]